MMSAEGLRRSALQRHFTAYCFGKQELAGVTGAWAAAGAQVELHTMELEGYGPFRWLKKDSVRLHHYLSLLLFPPSHSRARLLGRVHELARVQSISGSATGQLQVLEGGVLGWCMLQGASELQSSGQGRPGADGQKHGR